MVPVFLFNVARYMTDSLRSAVLQTLRLARNASLMGRVVGLDGWAVIKSDLFFSFSYILNTYTNLYIYQKNILTHFLWVYNLDQLGVRKKQKYPIGRIFLNQCKGNMFTEEILVNFTWISFVNFTGILFVKLRSISIKGISYVKLKALQNIGPILF